jgi:DNA helicase-2/ATP-dependent DNA helicase PcrA
MPTAVPIDLNLEQRRAAEHRDGPLLVVAGAGTGKTRVITERIRLLLENDPALSGENILALTYTDKAANEMKYRIRSRVGLRADPICFSTFHAFCHQQILLPKKPDMHVIEDIDYRILLRRNIRRLNLKIFRRLADPGQFLYDFQQFFSRCQDELVSPDDYEIYVRGLKKYYEDHQAQMDPDLRAVQEENIARQEEIVQVYRIGDEMLREKNLLTFGALLMQAVQLLRADDAYRQEFRQRFRYILVDEFQDTNIAQLELLRLLMDDQRNIFVVGDHNQAIYRFRGASFGSLKTFLTDFCQVTPALPQDEWPRVHLLENYRSTKRILRVAGTVASESDDSSYVPFTRLETQNGEGEKIRIAEFGGCEEEAEWITDEIERLHQAGLPWRDFAVLYRKHTHRDELVDTLIRRQIPFVIRGLSILSSTLIRDLLAYLRLISMTSDNVSCARVMAVPYWKIEPRDLVRLNERNSKNRSASLWAELESWVTGNPVVVRSKAAAAAATAGAGNGAPSTLVADSSASSSQASSSQASSSSSSQSLPQPKLPAGCRAAELVAFILGMRRRAKKLTALELLDEMIGRLGVTPLHADSDSDYLDCFREFVEQWQKKEKRQDLANFVEYLDYFEQANGDITLKKEPTDNAVQLMTVHGSKGLEFRQVFVMRLCRGDFPSRPRPAVFEFPVDLLKEEVPRGDFQKQEERRLFYVALTRAQRALSLTTIIDKRKKRSEFFNLLLEDPTIQRRDIQHLSPRVEISERAEAVGSAPSAPSAPLLFTRTPDSTKAYSEIALWANAFHPPQSEPLQLSASAIDSYKMCPMKYLFSYVWGLRGEPRGEMTFGNVIHRAIREIVIEVKKHHKLDRADLDAIYDRNWIPAGFLDDYHEEEYKNAGREQLAAFCESYCAAPPDVLMQEKTFELALDDNVIVRGRIDQINKLQGKTVEVIDYKTGRAKTAKDAEYSLQLSIYALAVEEVLGLTPDRLVFYNLTTNHPEVAARSSKDLDEVRAVVKETADSIRAADFNAKPGFVCRSCDYQTICPAHEQLIPISLPKN